jgi:hypothetical protein
MSNDRRHLRHIPTPPPLPATTDEMIAQRVGNFDISINDLVNDIHVVLWDSEPREGEKPYRDYLYALHDSQAVEGSLSADNHEAARAIRSYAQEHKIAGVRDENIATINKALNVVLRRFQLSRKQRRNMIHGEVVPDDNGTND